MYLVTGGYGEAPGGDYLASTELLERGAAQWTEAGPLPSARFGLRGVSLHNTVIVTGQPIRGRGLYSLFVLMFCSPHRRLV